MFLPHFGVFCDLLLNRCTATWNLFVLYNNETNYYRWSFFNFKIFQYNPKAGLCPLWRKRKKAIWRNLLSIQNEAISLVAMRSKELWLVHENHATVKLNSSVTSRGMKTYIESSIELRNLQILKKLLEKSSQFLSSEQPCEPKSFDVALKIAGVEKLRSGNLRLRSVNLEAIRFEFWIKGTLVTVEICVLCGWCFSNQFEIVSDTPLAVMQFAVSYTELYFARCCAMKRTGTFESEGKVKDVGARIF